jgi:hypothetical protein
MSRSNRKKDGKVVEGAQPGIVPAGTPDWIRAELVELTIRVWQPYYQAILTPEDAVNLIVAVGRLFNALASTGTPGNGPLAGRS